MPIRVVFEILSSVHLVNTSKITNSVFGYLQNGTMYSGLPFGLIEHLRTTSDCGEELRRNTANDDLLANGIV